MHVYTHIKLELMFIIINVMWRKQIDSIYGKCFLKRKCLFQTIFLNNFLILRRRFNMRGNF